MDSPGAAGEGRGAERLGAAGAVPLARDQLRGPPHLVAPRLLGAVLLRAGIAPAGEGPAGEEDPDGPATDVVALRVVEVEAYAGPGEDPCSHAHRGLRPRNRTMFATPGSLHVFRSYGRHWCANVVAHDGRPGDAGAVLVRAAEVVHGRSLARRRRPGARSERDLARGPGLLCAALGVSGVDEGLDLCDPASSVRLLAGPPPVRVRSGPRVGVCEAGEAIPWRWWDPDSPAVSRYRRGTRRRSGSSGRSGDRVATGQPASDQRT